MLTVNKLLKNFQFTDRILRKIYQLDQSKEEFIEEIISNFDYGSKSTITLIPQILFTSESKREDSDFAYLFSLGWVD